MKTPEDEAFDELARKQGAWGGGFTAKRKMAADKLQEPEREALKLLEEATRSCNNIDEQRALDALMREAQPAQEPDALTIAYQSGYYDGKKAAQRTWVGLTDDEVYKIAFTLEGEHWKKIADAIEAKLKEKNHG